MTPPLITKEQIKLALLAANIPIEEYSVKWFVIKRFTFRASMIDFQWPGFLGIPIQYRVLFLWEIPAGFVLNDMLEIESYHSDRKLIFIASERPAKISRAKAKQWFTVRKFIQAVERIPKSGNPFSLNLELQNAYRTNAEQQVMINRLQLEVEKLRLRVPDGE